ncbi:TlpA disulfide reductase family protein [Colwelliaceae bacterium 6471]
MTSKILLLLKTTFVFAFLTFISINSHALPLAKSQQQLDEMLKLNAGKVIYLDFWASWCGPCRKSFPWLNKLQQQHKDKGFTVISVNLDAEPKLAAKFLAEVPADFPVIYDPKGKTASHFKIKGMPSSIIFNRKGKIEVAHAGFFVKKIPEYESEINKLLNKE